MTTAEKRKATTLERHGPDFYKRVAAAGLVRQRELAAADPMYAKRRSMKGVQSMIDKYGADGARRIRQEAGRKSVASLTSEQLRQRAATGFAAAEKKYGPDWRRQAGSFSLDGLVKRHGQKEANRIIRAKLFKARSVQGYDQRIKNLAAGREKFFKLYGQDYVKNFCRKGGLRNLAKHGRQLGQNIKYPNGRGVSGDLYEAVLDVLEHVPRRTQEITDAVQSDCEASSRHVLRCLKLLVADGRAERHDGGYARAT